MSEGTVRVKKAATEFNISVQHLVEHLASKGFSVESNPNAKISEEMYQMLLRDFGQDKKIISLVPTNLKPIVASNLTSQCPHVLHIQDDDCCSLQYPLEG